MKLYLTNMFNRSAKFKKYFQAIFSITEYRLRSARFVPGTGHDQDSGIISVEFVYNHMSHNAVICDFDRDGSKLDPKLLCDVIGK